MQKSKPVFAEKIFIRAGLTCNPLQINVRFLEDCGSSLQ
jgi:hypothetical protein